MVELDDPTKIKPDESYYFGITFGLKWNSLILEDVIKVNNFDNKMSYQ